MFKAIPSDLNSEGLKIVYDDVAPYAKEHSNPQILEVGLCPGSSIFPGVDCIPAPTVVREEFPELRRDDLVYPGYALCLPRFALLSGNYMNFPDNPGDYGYISEEISNIERKFGISELVEGTLPGSDTIPSMLLIPGAACEKKNDFPCMNIMFSQKFTSVGILLTFNTLSGDYASEINVKWYSGNVLLSDMDFTPDNTRYFCNNYVQLYDRIEITFRETSKPYRPVFLTRIDYGIYRDFFDDEIMESNCLQEINAISEHISVNTMSVTVRAKSSVPFDLQKKQRLQLYFNGKLLGNFYLRNGVKKSSTDYHMDTHDAIGVLDGTEFAGGVYAGQAVATVVSQIFEGEDFNYLLSEEFQTVKLYGYIPYSTKRTALQQIAFAIGAVVDTSNYDGVVIYPKQTEKTGEFSHSETFDGVTLEHSDVVTGIRLTVHSFQKGDESTELYKDVLHGTAEIVFPEPYHSLTITGGAIKTSGDNYAVITGSGEEVVLSGKKYNHFMSSILKENPDITFNKNVLEISEATLVHSGNAQAVLDRVYEYYQHPETVTGEVLLGDKMLGQIVEINTMYDGIRTGTLESIEYHFTRTIKAEVKIHE